MVSERFAKSSLLGRGADDACSANERSSSLCSFSGSAVAALIPDGETTKSNQVLIARVSGRNSD
jgi:hypothetical protein